MLALEKKLFDLFLRRFSYKVTKRIFVIFSLSNFIFFFGIPLFYKNFAYPWFLIGCFILGGFSSCLVGELRDQYGWANGDSDVLHEAENNLYKYFDDVISGKEYIMIQPKKIYPPLAELLEKEHYNIYFECGRYIVYKKKKRIDT